MGENRHREVRHTLRRLLQLNKVINVLIRKERDSKAHCKTIFSLDFVGIGIMLCWGLGRLGHRRRRGGGGGEKETELKRLGDT